MLAKLPPEKQGQLVAEAQRPEQMMNMAPGRPIGFKGTTMPSQMNQTPRMYRGPIGRR